MRMVWEADEESRPETDKDEACGHRHPVRYVVCEEGGSGVIICWAQRYVDNSRVGPVEVGLAERRFRLLR